MFYFASKTKNAKRWATLRATGVPIISSWIDGVRGIIPNPTPMGWYLNILEAGGCRALIAYFEEGEEYAGTFLEIGAALAHDRQVYVVGLTDQSQHQWSWLLHPNVHCVDTIETALSLAGYGNMHLLQELR